MKFYAVKVGRVPGIYKTWDECKTQVHGYPKSVYKSFSTLREAEEFIGVIPTSSVEEVAIDTLKVYTDGACSNNGKSDSSAGYAGYFGYEHPLNFQEKLIGEQTNNRAEMMAIIRTLQLVNDTDALIIYTDSMYCINGITSWIFGWERNEWKTSKGSDVLNKDLWIEMSQLKETKKSKD